MNAPQRPAVRHVARAGRIQAANATIGAALLLNPGELKAAQPELDARVPAFVEHYSHRRVHESLGNLTPTDVDFGLGEAILLARERIERQTIQRRRLLHHSQAA